MNNFHFQLAFNKYDTKNNITCACVCCVYVRSLICYFFWVFTVLKLQYFCFFSLISMTNVKHLFAYLSISLLYSYSFSNHGYCMWRLILFIPTGHSFSVTLVRLANFDEIAIHLYNMILSAIVICLCPSNTQIINNKQKIIKCIFITAPSKTWK